MTYKSFTASKLIWYLFFITVLLLPLYGGYFVWTVGFTAPPVSKSLWGSISFALIALLVMVSYRQRLFAFNNILAYAVVAVFAWGIISLSWAYHLHFGIYELVNAGVALCTFCVAVAIMDTRQKVHSIAWLLHIIAGLISIIVVGQYYLDEDFIFVGITDLAGFFGNKNMAMHYMVLMVPLGAFLVLNQRTSFQERALAAVLLLPVLMYITYTGTRSAYVAVAFEIFLVAVFYVLAKLKLHHNRQDLLLWLGFVIAYLIALALPSVLDLSSHFRPDELLARGGSGRMCVWESAWGMFNQKPWLGWGAGSYEAVVAVYDTCGRNVHRAHNEPLQLLLEMGIIGASLLALLWLVLAATLLRNSFIAWQQSKDSLPAFVLIVFLGSSTQSLFTFPLQLPYIVLALAVIIATSFAVLRSMGTTAAAPFKHNLIGFGSRFLALVFLVFALVLNFDWYREFNFYDQLLRGASKTEQEFKNATPMINNPLTSKIIDTILRVRQSSRVKTKFKIPPPVRLLMLENSLGKNIYNTRILFALGEHYRLVNDYAHAMAYHQAVVNISANTGIYILYVDSYFKLLEKKRGFEVAARTFESYVNELEKTWQKLNKRYFLISDQQTLANMALYYQQPQIMIRAIKRILKASPQLVKIDPQVSYLMAKAHFALADYEQTQLWLNQFLNYFPNSDKTAEARELLQQARQNLQR